MYNTLWPWKGKMTSNKVYNWSIELPSYKLTIQYIKGTKTILADCLPILFDANLTDHNYEPKAQEFGWTTIWRITTSF